MSENEINTVHVLIRRFLYEIDGILEDKDKCQKWLVSFAKTLQFQELCKEPNEYAVFLLNEAKGFCATQKKNSQIKQVRKILKDEGVSSPTKEQLETRWKEMYVDATDLQATANSQVTDEQRTGGHMLPSSSRSPVRKPAQRRIRPPRSFEEVAEFADAQGLDYDDARLWWQRNFVERPGCDKDGVAFDNWKGALVNACRAEEAKRNG